MPAPAPTSPPTPQPFPHGSFRQPKSRGLRVIKLLLALATVATFCLGSFVAGVIWGERAAYRMASGYGRTYHHFFGNVVLALNDGRTQEVKHAFDTLRDGVIIQTGPGVNDHLRNIEDLGFLLSSGNYTPERAEQIMRDAGAEAAEPIR